MEGFEVLAGVITMLAAVLLLISLLAYKREGSRPFFLVSVVFGLFLLKGIMLTLAIFSDNIGEVTEPLVLYLLFDVVILLFMLIAAFKRPEERVNRAKPSTSELGSKEERKSGLGSKEGKT